MNIDLDELEKRVAEKWVAKAAERLQEIPDSFDVTNWIDGPSTWTTEPLSEPAFQFPREQWISYPTKRTYMLLVLDRLLDCDLTDEQWAQACFFMHYGGKERVA